jgi:hypothetical protein
VAPGNGPSVVAPAPVATPAEQLAALIESLENPDLQGDGADPVRCTMRLAASRRATAPTGFAVATTSA